MNFVLYGNRSFITVYPSYPVSFVYILIVSSQDRQGLSSRITDQSLVWFLIAPMRAPRILDLGTR
jgi:hypothetical protein